MPQDLFHDVRTTRLPAMIAVAVMAVLLLGAGILAVGHREGVVMAGSGTGGASNLTLDPDLSFTDDSSANFPIRGENLGVGQIASDRPTAIFFGTSHCWNTNREAERFVALYAKEKEATRFLVVDLNNQTPAQRDLVSRFYRGSIPTLAFLDRAGKIVYNQAGETSSRRGDTSKLEEILAKAKAGSR